MSGGRMGGCDGVMVLGDRGGGWECRGKVLMYQLISRRTFVAKSCVGGEGVCMLAVVCVRYLSHSHIGLSR